LFAVQFFVLIIFAYSVPPEALKVSSFQSSKFKQPRKASFAASVSPAVAASAFRSLAFSCAGTAPARGRPGEAGRLEEIEVIPGSIRRGAGWPWVSIGWRRAARLQLVAAEAR
jgi:hypothetical protein